MLPEAVSPSTANYRIGIDIGGTFTDLVVMDEATGQLRLVKMASTPSDPSVAFIQVIERMLKESGLSPSNAAYLAHGTTVATNTIIEGKGARTALIITKGFRDVLEIGRQIRPRLYDLACEKPAPLVPRDLAFEVEERLSAAGSVISPLDESGLAPICERLVREQVESVAVCLLHSYANPVHEQLVGAYLARAVPAIKVSLSSELCPEMREYFRASTTAVNAVVLPVVSRYIRRLENRLVEKGINTTLHLMTSSGGVLSSHTAQAKPVNLIESGPAAGVTAAAYLGSAAGYPDLISFDMGGTTAKMGLIHGGKPKVAPHFEVGAAATSGDRGAGYPVRTPVIDLVEIGAGGGSIAWMDEGGGLRVGPRSGGADPGPACYGRGQTSPTVTDAHLYLGRLNPEYFIGGEHALRKDLAEKALETLAKRLGISTMSLAIGILDIANASMVAAASLISVQRGFDPREFVLIGYGGAGPLHANAIAHELGVKKVMIPMSPGLTCALGLLVGDIKHTLKQSFLRVCDDLKADDLVTLWDGMAAKGESLLQKDGITPAKAAYLRSVDLRYCGQSYELTVDCTDLVGAPDFVEALLEGFRSRHRQLYGYASEDEPIEIVNLSLVATGKIRQPDFKRLEPGGADASAAIKGSREVHFTGTGMKPCRIYDRYRLLQGNTFAGPAIVEEYDSTIVIQPGYSAEVDSFGNLLIQKQ